MLICFDNVREQWTNDDRRIWRAFGEAFVDPEKVVSVQPYEDDDESPITLIRTNDSATVFVNHKADYVANRINSALRQTG